MERLAKLVEEGKISPQKRAKIFIKMMRSKFPDTMEAMDKARPNWDKIK